MSDKHDEGHSPAAWTAVVIMLVSFAVGTIAFWFEQPVIVVIAAVFVFVGLLVGWAMARAGYGVDGPKSRA